jgi:hypothetical protein
MTQMQQMEGLDGRLGMQIGVCEEANGDRTNQDELRHK